MRDEPDWFLPDDTPPPAGDNKPPDMVATVQETMKAVSDWLAEHPVIEGFDDAKEAKVMLDRGKLAIKDMEDERTFRVSPLNRQVSDINDYYRAPREQLTRVLQFMNVRLTEYISREEKKRAIEAEKARLKLEEAERIAREAEEKERKAKEEAEQGVLGVDIRDKVVEADKAFSDYEKAQRAAALAEKETHVKVAGGFTRAIGLRTETILEVTDAVKAVRAITKQGGISAAINEAIIKTAKAYKVLTGEYPPGVKAKIERKV